MAKVGHFEIEATDPEILIKFYESVFGWKIKQWTDQPYWLIMAGDKDEMGANGAIKPREEKDDGKRMNGYINTIMVESIEDAVEKIKKNGGKVTTEIMDIPKVGRMVYAQDPDMNKFGAMEPDPNPEMMEI